MEEIFETLREQIKGDFDQNNIIIILDNSISLTCKKHPIPGTNNSIIIIQPYLIDTLENIGKQSLNIFEYFHRVQIYLDLLIQVQWIKMSLNLKCYFIRQFIQQKLFELNEHITRYEIITRQPLTKEYIRFFNEPKKQYELTIKNYLQWKILNLLSEELLEQIFVYLIDINWEEDQIDEILDQISEIGEELELEYNYNYHIRYRTQRLKIQNQIEQESQQLIKNLIPSNQINNVTPTQIKIQF